MRCEPIPGPDFHLCDALVEKRLRQFARLFEESILIRVFWSVDAGVVDTNPFPAPTTEQIVDGLAYMLAEQIPECDVEGGDRPHLCTGISEKVRPAEERLPVSFPVKRALPEQHRRRKIVNDGFNSSRLIIGLSQTNQSCIGVNEYPDQVGKGRDTKCFDASDFQCMLS